MNRKSKKLEVSTQETRLGCRSTRHRREYREGKESFGLITGTVEFKHWGTKDTHSDDERRAGQSIHREPNYYCEKGNLLPPAMARTRNKERKTECYPSFDSHMTSMTTEGGIGH